MIYSWTVTVQNCETKIKTDPKNWEGSEICQFNTQSASDKNQHNNNLVVTHLSHEWLWFETKAFLAFQQLHHFGIFLNIFIQPQSTHVVYRHMRSLELVYRSTVWNQTIFQYQSALPNSIYKYVVQRKFSNRNTVNIKLLKKNIS